MTFDGRAPFIIDKNNQIVIKKGYNSIYFGISNKDNPSRSTILTPSNLYLFAFNTSGNIYAWYIIESPEASYAIRSEPVNGKIIKINIVELIQWIKKNIYGHPPHKMNLKDYVKHLREIGFTIHILEENEKEIRFNLIDMTTEDERISKIKELQKLTEEDFAKFDWSEYDKNVVTQVCNVPNEIAGDVTIDIKNKKISAPKIRPGLIWGARAYERSLVSFHTHPSARYNGQMAEPPSNGDITVNLEKCAFNLCAWDFVSTPEGTYIYRASSLSMNSYLKRPQETLSYINNIYDIYKCNNSTANCVQESLIKLKEAGFIAYFHENPCMEIEKNQPNVMPEWNNIDLNTIEQDIKYVRELKPEKFASFNWSEVLSMSTTPSLSSNSWLTVNIKKNKIIISGDGHKMGDIHDEYSYPMNAFGPIFVICFPRGIPSSIPHAAIAMAEKQRDNWIWVVFISKYELIIFRVDENGVESYGPYNHGNNK